MTEPVLLFPDELIKLRFYIDFSETPGGEYERLNYDQLFEISREDLHGTFRNTETFNLQGITFNKSFNIEYNTKTHVSWVRLMLTTPTRGQKKIKLNTLLASGWKQPKAAATPMVTPKLKNKPRRT